MLWEGRGAESDLGPLGDQLGGANLATTLLSTSLTMDATPRFLVVQPQALVHAGQLHGIGSDSTPQEMFTICRSKKEVSSGWAVTGLTWPLGKGPA